MTSPVRFIILSDLHPSIPGDSGTGESFLNMRAPWDTGINPIAGFCELIKRENLSAEYLLCPGDIGNKAAPETITFGWTQLQRIALEMGAPLIAVPGNHDHDSRSVFNGFDPKYHLQSLEPSFPFSDTQRNAHFWSYHWGEYLDTTCRILLLNTSAFHGLSDEYMHGRVTPLTLNQLKHSLSSPESRSINLILCHHHPVRLDDVYVPDYEAMEGGSDLVRILSDGLMGNWMIVHGHKHTPRIVYASSYGSQSTVVFSSGSFSGPIAPALNSKTTNQVHLLSIAPHDSANYGCICGTVRTWEWNHGLGWQRAESGRGLPHSAGFGYRKPLAILASELKERFEDRPFATGKEVYDCFPALRYLTPTDLQALAAVLSTKHNGRLEISSGEIKQFGVNRDE
jgi:3',5'-cyclic AMP phosphodiesterase CpdA